MFWKIPLFISVLNSSMMVAFQSETWILEKKKKNICESQKDAIIAN